MWLILCSNGFFILSDSYGRMAWEAPEVQHPGLFRDMADYWVANRIERLEKSEYGGDALAGEPLVFRV